jgi:hypothetical protein
MNTYKFVFIFVYCKHNGMASTKKKPSQFFLEWKTFQIKVVE